jgi:hypothetical protein
MRHLNDRGVTRVLQARACTLSRQYPKVALASVSFSPHPFGPIGRRTVNTVRPGADLFRNGVVKVTATHQIDHRLNRSSRA